MDEVIDEQTNDFILKNFQDRLHADLYNNFKNSLDNTFLTGNKFYTFKKLIDQLKEKILDRYHEKKSNFKKNIIEQTLKNEEQIYIGLFLNCESAKKELNLIPSLEDQKIKILELKESEKTKGELLSQLCQNHHQYKTSVVNNIIKNFFTFLENKQEENERENKEFEDKRFLIQNGEFIIREL